MKFSKKMSGRNILDITKHACNPNAGVDGNLGSLKLIGQLV